MTVAWNFAFSSPEMRLSVEGGSPVRLDGEVTHLILLTATDGIDHSRLVRQTLDADVSRIDGVAVVAARGVEALLLGDDRADDEVSRAWARFPPCRKWLVAPAPESSRLIPEVTAVQPLSIYATTLRGGNVELKSLVEKKREEYALDNLRFALLEFLPLRTDDQRAIDREV